MGSWGKTDIFGDINGCNVKYSGGLRVMATQERSNIKAGKVLFNGAVDISLIDEVQQANRILG